MTTSELDKLSTQDKIILLEQVWSSLKQEGDKLNSPLWHKEILAERRKKIETGEAEYLSLDDLKSRSK